MQKPFAVMVFARVFAKIAGEADCVSMAFVSNFAKIVGAVGYASMGE